MLIDHRGIVRSSEAAVGMRPFQHEKIAVPMLVERGLQSVPLYYFALAERLLVFVFLLNDAFDI